MNQNNTISHVEIPAPDLGKAISFYSEIFNWKIEVVTEDRYAFFKIGDAGTGGGFDASLKPAEEKWGCQIVIDVNDIEEIVNKIKTAGGSITKTKTEIGDGHGFYACFQDPNGNHLQIHSPV